LGDTPKPLAKGLCSSAHPWGFKKGHPVLLISTPCVPLLPRKDWGTLRFGGYPQTPGKGALLLCTPLGFQKRTPCTPDINPLCPPPSSEGLRDSKIWGIPPNPQQRDFFPLHSRGNGAGHRLAPTSSGISSRRRRFSPPGRALTGPGACAPARLWAPCSLQHRPRVAA